VPGGVRAEGGWRALKVLGPLDFSLTGILAGLASTLAAAGVSIFALSTFDTDYIMVKESSLGTAIEALREQGHTIHAD
ncbi:MAG: ACT domain-containing protein, partial [Anaerolineaceae bacterium]|nr:ACT domain-containing protein [Anaerolineaceae bacterium]